MLTLAVEIFVVSCIVKWLWHWANAPEGRGVDVPLEIERTLTEGGWWSAHAIAEDIDKRYKLRRLRPPKLGPYLHEYLEQMWVAGSIEAAYFKTERGEEIRFRLIVGRKPPSGGPRQKMGVPTLTPDFGLVANRRLLCNRFFYFPGFFFRKPPGQLFSSKSYPEI